MAPPFHNFTLAAATSHGALSGGVAMLARGPPFTGAALLRCCLAAGAAPPRRCTLALVVPGGTLASKGGRRAVAVAAAAGAPGPGDDGDVPPSDPEGAFGNAKDCMPLMEFLIGKKAVDEDTYKELLSAGRAVVVVEGQSDEGYVRADALANAIEGLKLFGRVFFNIADLPHYTTPLVPLSGDDVDKKSYFRELINIFIIYYTALAWEAYYKYGFDRRAGN